MEDLGTTYFLKLKERVKSYMVTIIATDNKPLRTIYSVLIHGTFYSPNCACLKI
jgi:hypothetical protein